MKIIGCHWRMTGLDALLILLTIGICLICFVMYFPSYFLVYVFLVFFFFNLYHQQLLDN